MSNALTPGILWQGSVVNGGPVFLTADSGVSTGRLAVVDNINLSEFDFLANTPDVSGIFWAANNNVFFVEYIDTQKNLVRLDPTAVVDGSSIQSVYISSTPVSIGNNFIYHSFPGPENVIYFAGRFSTSKITIYKYEITTNSWSVVGTTFEEICGYSNGYIFAEQERGTLSVPSTTGIPIVVGRYDQNNGTPLGDFTLQSSWPGFERPGGCTAIFGEGSDLYVIAGWGENASSLQVEVSDVIAIHKYDPDSLSEVGSINLSSLNSSGTVNAYFESYAVSDTYIAVGLTGNTIESSIVLIDKATFSVVSTIRVVSGAQDLSFTPDGQTLLATIPDFYPTVARTLASYDVSSGQLVEKSATRIGSDLALNYLKAGPTQWANAGNPITALPGPPVVISGTNNTMSGYANPTGVLGVLDTGPMTLYASNAQASYSLVWAGDGLAYVPVFNETGNTTTIWVYDTSIAITSGNPSLIVSGVGVIPTGLPGSSVVSDVVVGPTNTLYFHETYSPTAQQFRGVIRSLNTSTEVVAQVSATEYLNILEYHGGSLFTVSISGDIVKLDPTTGTSQGTFTIAAPDATFVHPDAPKFLVSDGTNLYAANAWGSSPPPALKDRIVVSKINPATMSEVDRVVISEQSGSSWISVNTRVADVVGGFLAIVDSGANGVDRISVIDTATMTVVDSITLPVNIGALSFSGDGTRLFAAASNTSSVDTGVIYQYVVDAGGNLTYINAYTTSSAFMYAVAARAIPWR